MTEVIDRPGDTTDEDEEWEPMDDPLACHVPASPSAMPTKGIVKASDPNAPGTKSVRFDPDMKMTKGEIAEMLASKPKGTVYRAIAAYSSDDPDDLSFKPNTLILVYDEGDGPDDWWEGVIHGREGCFPGTYVKKMGYQPDDTSTYWLPKDEPDMGPFGADDTEDKAPPQGTGPVLKLSGFGGGGEEEEEQAATDSTQYVHPAEAEPILEQPEAKEEAEEEQEEHEPEQQPVARPVLTLSGFGGGGDEEADDEDEEEEEDGEREKEIPQAVEVKKEEEAEKQPEKEPKSDVVAAPVVAEPAVPQASPKANEDGEEEEEEEGMRDTFGDSPAKSFAPSKQQPTSLSVPLPSKPRRRFSGAAGLVDARGAAVQPQRKILEPIAPIIEENDDESEDEEAPTGTVLSPLPTRTDSSASLLSTATTDDSNSKSEDAKPQDRFYCSMYNVIAKQAEKDNVPLSRCGWLQKKGGGKDNVGRMQGSLFARRNWKSRWFNLKDNELVYFKSTSTEKPLGKILMTPETMITLEKQEQLTFFIQTNTRQYSLRASTPGEAKQWIATLEAACTFSVVT